VRGTRKNAKRASVWRGRRFSAKNKRLKLLARASTLATEAITPSFTSSVIRISLSVTPPLYRADGNGIEFARKRGIQDDRRSAHWGRHRAPQIGTK
jgi:hypothetical protein